MNAGDIVKAVRWCIDEEAVDVSSLDGASDFDFDDETSDIGLMNNIIKGKIPAALRWVCLYAPADQLSGVSSSGGGGEGSSSESEGIEIIVEETHSANENVITPNETLIRVIRVKGSDWHRAILGDSLIKEDSDEYLAVHDTNGAQATADRPQAALRNTKEKAVEVYPGTGTFTLTYIKALTADDLSGLYETGWETTNVGIPDNVETSFIYYLAYLLCSAYGDSRAPRMLEIATMNLGRSEDKQRQ